MIEFNPRINCFDERIQDCRYEEAVTATIFSSAEIIKGLLKLMNVKTFLNHDCE
jgi:hypothetical protein